MSISLTNTVETRSSLRSLLPLCVGAAAFLFCLSIGDGSLEDSDSFWQIKVGQWILNSHAVPYSDSYSFTKFGAPWISTSWLSQVLYAAVHTQSDWAGPVILASFALAATLAIFVYLLSVYFEAAHCVLFAMLALWLSLSHFLTRPHLLALPVMVAWIGGMIAAADRRAAPPLLLLPLMALWANLHGGFILGLALIAPVALVAIWETDDNRASLATRWALFAICAAAAGCCNPYGWNAFLGAARILNLGELLSILGEWKSADFSRFGVFEASLLGLVALGFFGRLVLSPPRILLILGLIYMALTHVRSIEAYAFLVPFALAKPLAAWLRPGRVPSPRSGEFFAPPYVTPVAALAIVGAVWASTLIYLSHHHFVFVKSQMPTAAVGLLKQRKAERIFNAYEFGGYLISTGVPTFIDGRAELYGESFVTRYFDAIWVHKVDNLLQLLGDYHIDATLLAPKSPAAQVMDHIRGWKKLYADETAVIHVRDSGADH
jgi:hypothetical protein